MTAEIGNGRSAHPTVEPPIERDLGIDELVREPAAAPELQLADGAFVDHALHQRNGGEASIVEADRIRHAGPARSLQGTPAFGVGGGQGLLAEHGLARRGGGSSDLGMGAGRRADVDDVDVLAFNDPAPVGRHLLEAIGRGSLLDQLAPAAADQSQAGADRQITQSRRLTVAIGMGLAHHAIADDADPDLGCRGHRRFSPLFGMIPEARSAASRAATASSALAPSAGAPPTQRTKLSACSRSASRKDCSASGGQRKRHFLRAPGSEQLDLAYIAERKAPAERAPCRLSHRKGCRAPGRSRHRPGRRIGPGRGGDSMEEPISWPVSQRI